MPFTRPAVEGRGMGDRIVAKRKQAGPAGAGAPAPEAPRTKKFKSAQPKLAPTKATTSGSVPTSRPGVQEPKKAARPKAIPFPAWGHARRHGVHLPPAPG